MPMTKREFNRRISMMDKVTQMKKDFKILLPEIEQDKYIVMLSHIAYYCEDKKNYRSRNGRKKTYTKKALTEAEKIILDYLLKNNLVPITIYRWFRVCKLPEDIQGKLKKGQISVKEAIRTGTNRLKQRQSNSGLLMMEEINNIISGL